MKLKKKTEELDIPEPTDVEEERTIPEQSENVDYERVAFLLRSNVRMLDVLKEQLSGRISMRDASSRVYHKLEIMNLADECSENIFRYKNIMIAGEYDPKEIEDMIKQCRKEWNFN